MFPSDKKAFSVNQHYWPQVLLLPARKFLYSAECVFVCAIQKLGKRIRPVAEFNNVVFPESVRKPMANGRHFVGKGYKYGMEQQVRWRMRGNVLVASDLGCYSTMPLLPCAPLSLHGVPLPALGDELIHRSLPPPTVACAGIINIKDCFSG